MSDLKTLGRVSPSGNTFLRLEFPHNVFPGSLNRFEGWRSVCIGDCVEQWGGKRIKLKYESQ